MDYKFSTKILNLNQKQGGVGTINKMYTDYKIILYFFKYERISKTIRSKKME